MNLRPFLFALLIATLVCPAALALSITPAKIAFDTPGEHAFTIRVLDEGEHGIASISAQGDLAGRISFDQQTLELGEGAVFTGTIDVPEDLEPGDHVQEVAVSLRQLGSDGITATVEVASILVVRKTYPGPYLVLSAYSSADEGVLDTATLHLSLENRGDAAVTPIVRLTYNGTTQELPAQEIPARGSAQLSMLLRGRGEERVLIDIQGAQPLHEELLATIGHPIITGVRAQAIPEAGAIKPIRVDANVSWNRPVECILTIDGKERTVTIDGAYSEIHYIETNSTAVPVSLRVGAQRMETVADLVSPSRIEPEQSALRWEWIALVVLLALVLFVLYRLSRKPLAQ